MKIRFQTNLDAPQRDIFSLNSLNPHTDILPIPRVGERISFPFQVNSQSFSYELQVIGILYEFMTGHIYIELHIPSWQNVMSIEEWTKWFMGHRYGSKDT